MPHERRFVVVLLALVIVYCLMILSSDRLTWLRRHRERINTVLAVVLLVVVSVYLFSIVLPGVARVD